MTAGQTVKYGPQGKRMLSGIIASGFNIFSRIGVQLLIVPVLFSSWSAELVGIWLLLTSIPSYLGLTASGFGSAGGNLTIAAEKDGDRALAQGAFWATWLLVTASNLVIVVAFAIASEWIISADLFQTTSVAAGELRAAIFWQCAYVLLSVQGAALVLPYRHGGQYPRNIFLGSLQSTVEVVVTAIVVMQTERLDLLAMALAGVRLAFLGIIFWYGYRASPGLFGRPPASRIREALASVWRPSLAFMAAPLVFGFNLQGYNLLVGAFFGPVVLASFVATRIFVRVLDIITNFAYSLQFFELPYLEGAAAEGLMRRIVAAMTASMLVLSIAFVIGVAATGEVVLTIWTVGQAQYDWGVALALALSGAIRAVSISPAATLSAMNLNSRFMTIYTLSSALSFALAMWLGSMGVSLSVLVLTLLLAELGQAIPAFIGTSRVLGYPLHRMLGDVLSIRTRFRDILSLRRELTA